MDEQQELKAKIRSKTWKSSFHLAVLVIYLFFGAVLFNFLEFQARQDEVEAAAEELEENRAELLKVLWGATIAKNEGDWTIIANERLDLYEHDLKSYFARHVDIDNPLDTPNPWNLIGSFFYSFTVVTTIGYGNMAPETDEGKIVTIIYGLIGIPLTLLVLAEIGKLLTLALKFWAIKSQQDSMDSSEVFNFGPITALLLTFVFVFTGAAIFSLMEEWDLLDASYFSFVTFSTIGFGDIVPTHEEYLLFTVVYIFCALSLFSMCFCSIQEFVDPYVNSLQEGVENWWSRKNKFRGENEENEENDSIYKKSAAFKPSPKVQHRIWTKRVDEDNEEEEDESIVE